MGAESLARSSGSIRDGLAGAAVDGRTEPEMEADRPSPRVYTNLVV